MFRVFSRIFSLFLFSPAFARRLKGGFRRFFQAIALKLSGLSADKSSLKTNGAYFEMKTIAPPPPPKVQVQIKSGLFGFRLLKPVASLFKKRLSLCARPVLSKSAVLLCARLAASRLPANPLRASRPARSGPESLVNISKRSAFQETKARQPLFQPSLRRPEAGSPQTLLKLTENLERRGNIIGRIAQSIPDLQHFSAY